jgi:hypothetical protein
MVELDSCHRTVHHSAPFDLCVFHPEAPVLLFVVHDWEPSTHIDYFVQKINDIDSAGPLTTGSVIFSVLCFVGLNTNGSDLDVVCDQTHFCFQRVKFALR